MAVPKKKTSKSKRNMRRSHDALKSLNIIENKTTGELQLPHQISLDGYYNGKQVIKEKEKPAPQAEDQAKEEVAQVENIEAKEASPAKEASKKTTKKAEKKS